MPRPPRRAGEFLHIVTRGIGKQIIFESNADRTHYLDRLTKYRDETTVELLAYCLMENHVHLLIRDTEQHASILMKKLGVSYAGYFNRSHGRSGHLFQGRFSSATITDERYLISAFRYILKNPEKAGICPAAAYRWSSYTDYRDGRTGVSCVTDTEFMRGTLEAFGGFERVMEQDDEAEHLEGDRQPRSDAEALRLVQKALGCASGTELQRLPKGERDEQLRQLKALGLSTRQIERVTGINRGAVQRA